MTAAPKRRRRWADAAKRGASTERKMPVLVDGQLTPSQLIAALEILRADGPEEPMTLDEVMFWLDLHVQRPRPPAPSRPASSNGTRRLRRHNRPAGEPGRLTRQEATAAA